MRRTIVVNAVGLTRRLISARTPTLAQLTKTQSIATIRQRGPGLTCVAQANYLTGCGPSSHGIVGNGFFHRDTREIRFWHQSDSLVRSPRIWHDVAALGGITANLFWWFAMHAANEIAVTPRPVYFADGRKQPDLWTRPPSLRDELQSTLGQFPLFNFWGPTADIRSTKWIVDSTIEVVRRFVPTLTLVYLPHLDYDLQRCGPEGESAQRAAAELDAEIARIAQLAEDTNSRLVILSEYGIVPVSRVVHLNRVLRDHGLLAIRREPHGELLDAGESTAFAVADHQVAHVYVNDSKQIGRVAEIVSNTPGVGGVLVGGDRATFDLDHDRAGEIVALADRDAWFSYYYWLDDSLAPDFARTVDIHRKPGYDPAELFFDPNLRFPKLAAGFKLAKRKLGFRQLMNVIGLDASIVRGSHGLLPADELDAPILIADTAVETGQSVDALDVKSVLLRHLTT